MKSGIYISQNGHMVLKEEFKPVSGFSQYAQKGSEEGKRLVARLEKKLAKKGLI